MANDNTHVHLDHGGADTDEFWDVGLSDLQLAHADVRDDSRRGFSMHVDPESGAVSLNEGYEPGSEPHGDESSMFAEFRDAAVEGLAAHARSRDILPAFLAMADAEAEDRKARLVDLGIALEETADGLADCADGIHSWTGETGRLPADAECTRCGEPYGDPD